MTPETRGCSQEWNEGKKMQIGTVGMCHLRTTNHQEKVLLSTGNAALMEENVECKKMKGPSLIRGEKSHKPKPNLKKVWKKKFASIDGGGTVGKMRVKTTLTFKTFCKIKWTSQEGERVRKN